MLEFREEPSNEVAEEYVKQGPENYLWNSGMFIWRARTLSKCMRKYELSAAEGLQEIADIWNTPDQDAVLNRIFPTLKKPSVDFGVMEPASKDSGVQVAAIPMPLGWLDIGSWPSFAETRVRDSQGNALGAEKHLLHESEDCLVVSSDPEHLIAAIGCRDLVVIHTDRATLICRAESAEEIKEVQKLVSERFGAKYT